VESNCVFVELLDVTSRHASSIGSVCNAIVIVN